MRRAQSTRHYARPSLALAADDLGVLREGDESNEDVLRRQLLDKDREVDRLKLQAQALQDQLSQRPPVEQFYDLQQEFKNLELILKGTQRENEKQMNEGEQYKIYIKTLERELARLVGENFKEILGIGPTGSPTTTNSTFRGGLHHRSNTIASPIVSSSPFARGTPPIPQSRSPTPSSKGKEDRDAQKLAQLEQLRLLILGMEQRLEVREEKLSQTVEMAESEGRKYEAAART